MTGSDDRGPDLATGYGIEIDGVRIAWLKDGTYHFSPPPEDSSVPTEFHGAVPIAELERLADELESDPPFEVTQDAPYQAIEGCAQELRELIAEYGGLDE